jgi:hypothetical protein
LTGILDLFGWVRPGEAEAPAHPSRQGVRDQPGPPVAGSINAGLLGKVARGGKRFDRLVLTRNTRVMASVADGGRTLRLHEAFAEAPAEVLEAVGSLFGARNGRTRAAARAIVRDFLGTTLPDSPPRRPRRPPQPRPADLPHIRSLREEFDRVNQTHFASSLPDVPIRLSGRMRRRNGHFGTDPVEIAISRELCVRAEDGEALRTLRHEMIHCWQWTEGRKIGHGADFRRWARALDIHPRATRVVCWQGEKCGANILSTRSIPSQRTSGAGARNGRA